MKFEEIYTNPVIRVYQYWDKVFGRVFIHPSACETLQHGAKNLPASGFVPVTSSSTVRSSTICAISSLLHCQFTAIKASQSILEVLINIYQLINLLFTFLGLSGCDIRYNDERESFSFQFVSFFL